jgi:hypothetical protein
MMQLISLNTWGGRVPGIDSFLEAKKKDTTIFCFQEVYNNAPLTEMETEAERPNFFDEVKTILSDFHGYFAPQIEGIGLASFVHKDISVENVSSTTILSAEDLHDSKFLSGDNQWPRVLQSIFLKEHNLTIYNFHGFWSAGKQDSSKSDLQTSRLLDILNKDQNRKILTGDFNLNPDTEAISSLEKILQNPLKDSGFTSTRSSLYGRRDAMPFADYTFVSSAIKIQDFQVLPDEVSDHLALQLKFQ